MLMRMQSHCTAELKRM